MRSWVLGDDRRFLVRGNDRRRQVRRIAGALPRVPGSGGSLIRGDESGSRICSEKTRSGRRGNAGGTGGIRGGLLAAF